MIAAVLAGLLAAAQPEGFRTIDWYALSSGVRYKVISSGEPRARRPRPGDEIAVHYDARLMTGEVFDSSLGRGQPARFQLEGLISCWMEVLPRMKVGDEWAVICPPETAYGEEGSGEVVPPNSTVSFRILLIGVTPRPR